MASRFSLGIGKNRIGVFVPIFICVLVLVIGFQRSPATAQASVNRAEITQILDSSDVFIQNKQAKVKDSAQKGQRVRTADARAQLLFNTGAVGRLAHNSVLTVGQCARLKQGTLLINGAMNGCTSSVVAGVRGTTYLLEVDEAGEAQVKVLEGEVTVTKPATPVPDEAIDETDKETSTPATGAKQLMQATKSTLLAQAETDGVVLKEGEKVSVSPTGSFGLVEKLSQEEFTNLLKGTLFNGFSLELPGISKVQQSFQRLYPGVPFPISIPGIPGIPTPPVRIPLPF